MVNYITKREAAELLRVQPRTVNRLMADRLLPSYRTGNILRFRPEDVLAVLQRVPAAGEPKRRAGRINETTTAAK